MYGYGYRYNSGLVVGSGGGGAPFSNTYSTSFDGIDDYINLGSGLDIFGSDFTISLWAKWGAQTSNSNGLINFAANTNKAVITLGFGSQYGKISFGTGSSSTIGILYDCGSGYDDNNWHHIMCTLQGTTRTIYVDGVDISSTGSVSSIGVGSNNDIGNRARSRYFVGNVDEVSVFDSVIPIGDLWDGSGQPTDLSLLATSPINWLRMGDNGAYKSPQWLIPNNENKDKVSNYSFAFDGVDDYINIGNAISFEYNDTFSYSFWIKPDSDSGVKYLFSKYASSRGVLIYLNSSSAAGNNTLNFNLYNVGSGTPSSRKYITTNSTNMALPNEWTNIIITYDGSGVGSGISFYKNGVSQSVTVTNDSLASNTIVTSQDAYISGNNFASSFYPGKQDEWAIFNTELSSADALAIYNSGTPTTLPSGAVAHYKMGEEATFSTNWTVPDAIGSNDGTSNAMTIEDRVGDAPNSTSNSVSYNMDEVDRVEDTP